MTDQDLARLLRATSLPITGEGPSHDLWPLVVDRIHARREFSRLDIGIAAVVTVFLLLFPKTALLLAYHL
jgi:hypothetical protein